MEAVLFTVLMLFPLLVIHIWGRSRFVGAWTGVLLMLVSMWLLSDPAVIPAGVRITYTQDADGTVIGETHTVEYAKTPEVWPGAGLTIAKLFGFGFVPVALYMIFWNTLHPRP